MSGIIGKNSTRGSGAIGTSIIGADAVSGANIADDAIDSEHYVDGSIDNAHIADDAINSEHYADGSIDNAHIADDAIDSEHYADGSIDNAHIADDAIDSEHYADGSIDNAHIADDAIDSEHYADGSIDNAHIADDAIDSEHYADASIDTAHIATNQIDETLMKDAFVGDFTDATVTASDYFLHGDATDSGNTKKDTIQGILDLAGGGSTTQVKTIYKTFDVSTSTGTFAVTGVGFEPQFVFILAAEHETLVQSWGFGTTGGGSKINAVNWRKADADGISGVTTEIAYYWPNGSHRVLIDIDSMDSDGATFGNLKVGSPTGNFIMYMFFILFYVIILYLKVK